MTQWQPPPQYGQMPPRDPQQQQQQQSWPTHYQQHRQFAPPQKHSGLGIASFILAMVVGIGMFILIVIAGVMESRTPGGIDENAPEAVVLGLLLIGGMLLALVGGVLGLVGLFVGDNKRVFAALGLAFNVLILLGVVGLMILGSLA